MKFGKSRFTQSVNFAMLFSSENFKKENDNF